MTFLRSVVVTFSNYKPLDTHTTLEDFLQYGFDNAYGSSQNDESIVGGIVLSRLGMDGADIENEFSETKLTQTMYIKALALETDMTQKYIKKLMDKKTNVYLDAEEAVNLGIADIIV